MQGYVAGILPIPRGAGHHVDRIAGSIPVREFGRADLCPNLTAVPEEQVPPDLVPHYGQQPSRQHGSEQVKKGRKFVCFDEPIDHEDVIEQKGCQKYYPAVRDLQAPLFYRFPIHGRKDGLFLSTVFLGRYRPDRLSRTVRRVGSDLRLCPGRGGLSGLRIGREEFGKIHIIYILPACGNKNGHLFPDERRIQGHVCSLIEYLVARAAVDGVGHAGFGGRVVGDLRYYSMDRLPVLPQDKSGPDGLAQDPQPADQHGRAENEKDLFFIARACRAQCPRAKHAQCRTDEEVLPAQMQVKALEQQIEQGRQSPEPHDQSGDDCHRCYIPEDSAESGSDRPMGDEHPD